MSYIDIHSHLLPGIDDGARNLEMSLQMLRTAQKEGIAEIIVTPHNKPARHSAGKQKISSLIKELNERMQEEGIVIKLHMGNELYYRSGLAEELMEGKGLTMAGSEYVLTEFSPMDDYDYIRNGIYSLTAGGYRPILAHVERYAKIRGRLDRVEELIKMGCYLQANAESILGNLGFQTKLFTKMLLKERLLHFVATDAHDMTARSPKMHKCASVVGRKYGEAYKEELFYENPMHVILNEYI